LGSQLERLLPSARAHCFFASSKKALTGVAAGCAHVAATHFHNAAGSGGEPEANVAAARAAMPAMPCRVIGFSLVEEGIMVSRGNPLRIRKAGDLACPDLRFVNREEGAALRRLLEAELAGEGVPASFIAGFEHCVRSHDEGAARVACGAADAALGLRLVAEAYGLHFVPLATTRCDLIIPLDLEDSPPLAALLDVLQSSRLRREIASLPGYESSFAGKVIALLP
jgi:molybdate-binding protein